MAKTMEAIIIYSNTEKEDAHACENNRTISLIAHASKIFLKIMQRRLEQYLERAISEEQSGFTKNRGT